MTESADVLDLGSSAEKRAGSNPVLGTNAAVAQLVEQRIFNPWVGCSSHLCGTNAGIAQLAEQRLCKSKVVGSSPAAGSKKL